MVVAWIAACLACQRAHDLGGIGWNSSKKMSIVVRPFVHGCRFSNRVADDDASSYGFVGFSSKWRTSFLIFVADPITVRWYSSAIAGGEHPARFGNCGGAPTCPAAAQI